MRRKGCVTVRRLAALCRSQLFLITEVERFEFTVKHVGFVFVILFAELPIVGAVVGVIIDVRLLGFNGCVNVWRGQGNLSNLNHLDILIFRQVRGGGFLGWRQVDGNGVNHDLNLHLSASSHDFDFFEL